VDIETGTDDPRRRPTKTYTWLKKNAADYGFIRTVGNEPWHWVYYGVSYAKKNIPSWQ
jgi:LAS superfamily LD-carboxypeptidase LdcB